MIFSALILRMKFIWSNYLILLLRGSLVEFTRCDIVKGKQGGKEERISQVSKRRRKKGSQIEKRVCF